uniref:Uncharacterized protein n=1 Tax=Anguilla anguilla TaxID=7936 RepID=A0A0E9UNF2_ANGAN
MALSKALNLVVCKVQRERKILH